MARSNVALIIAAGLMACAEPSRGPKSPNEPTVEGAANSEEVSPSGSVGRAPSDDNPAGSARSDRSVARHSSEPAAPGDAVELSDFCSDHRILANLSVERCVSTPLGARPDAQLWCSRREELDDNRVAYYVALYRVQGKALAKVTELTYAAGPRPLEERPQDVTYYVKLYPDVAADAKTFEMREEAGFNCDDAVKRLRDEFSTNPDLERSIEQLVTRVCMTRGKYMPNGQRQK